MRARTATCCTSPVRAAFCCGPRRLLAVLLLCFTAATAVSAQSLAGLWGSPLYRVELKVSGTSVTGSFTPLDSPQATPGAISGQLQAGGQAFTADWTYTSGPDTATFRTYLSLAGKSGVLSGYRWTEEAQPTSFALHRAVSGQLVQLVDQSTPVGSGPSAPGGGTGTVGGTSGAGTAPTADARLEVVTCETAPNGQPVNAAAEFTAPKTVTVLVRYTNLPPNSAVDWLWTLDGRTEAKLSKVVGGTGWHTHGLRSETAIIPGVYTITVSLNGREAARRTITVKAPATASTPPAGSTPAGGGTGGASTGARPGVEVTVCTGAPGGVPRNPGTSFTKPRQILCLVKHAAFPPDGELKWVWQRPSGSMTYTKRVSGTGWATHGFAADTALTPGNYKVTVYALGNEVTTVAFTVR